MVDELNDFNENIFKQSILPIFPKTIHLEIKEDDMARIFQYLVAPPSDPGESSNEMIDILVILINSAVKEKTPGV
jgi:hypothetical protein